MSGSPRTGDSLDFQACIGDIPCQRCNLPNGVTSQSSGGWKSIRLSPLATGGRGSARVVEPPRRFAPPLDGQSHVAPNVLGEFAVQLFQTQPVGWPPECETPPADKIQLEGAAHHRPTGWEKTVNQIARNVYVRRVRYDAGAGQHVGLSRAPDNHRDLYGVLNDGRYWLGLRIETTAENAQQRQRVLDYLRQQLK